MPLLTCPHCGQSYNPRYMRYCARCGEGVPDARGRKPKPGPMDGMGSRGGASFGKRQLTRARPVAPAESVATEWTPPQSVLDMILEYRNHLNEHPDDHATRYALGLAYALAREWRLGEVHLVVVAEAQPEFAEAFARLAVCRARLGNHEGALEAARRAHALEPDNARYSTLLQRLAEAP